MKVRSQEAGVSLWDPLLLESFVSSLRLRLRIPRQSWGLRKTLYPFFYSVRVSTFQFIDIFYGRVLFSVSSFTVRGSFASVVEVRSQSWTSLVYRTSLDPSKDLCWFEPRQRPP